MTNHQDNPLDNVEFISAGVSAWNSLTLLIEPKDATLFDDATEFKKFYSMVMEKLLEMEENE